MIKHINKLEYKALKKLIKRGKCTELELLENLMKKKLVVIIKKVNRNADINKDIEELKLVQKKVDKLLKNKYGHLTNRST